MKKLLAIVMVAVMVFSMSAVAFAEEDAARPYTVSYTAQENEDGSITVSVYAKGNVQAYDVGVSYKDTGATVKEMATAQEFKTAVSPLDVVNDVKDEGYVVFTGAALSDAAKDYDGIVGSVTFTGATDTAKFQILADTAKSEQFAVTEPGAFEVQEYVAPTEAPTPEPADETEAPAPSDETPAPAPSDATQAPAGNATQAPAGNGSSNAAKTADVAPVAAMVTLVLMAGAVLVVLKKRAAE